MFDHSDVALKNARRLRREMTLPEVLLWKILKQKPLGVKFRNQHPIGDYVADFYCAKRRLVIEIDGIAHDIGNRPARDDRRDAWLRSMGHEIIRIPATDVLRDAQMVANSLIVLCADIPPPSAVPAATSPKGGGLLGSI